MNNTTKPYFPDKTAVIVVYTLISVMALVGNSVVVFLIFYFRALRSPTNLLIANLAFADILIAVFCIPFSYWPILILQYWPFGYFLCKFLSFTKAATVYLNAYTLVAISFDRFFAVVFPFNRTLKMGHKGALGVLMVVWIIAFAIAGPTLFLTNIAVMPGDVQQQCEENWAGEGSRIYSGCVLVLQYFFPIVVLIVTYTAIVANIWRTRVKRSMDSIAQKSELRERKDSVKKLIPMMILVTSLYALCWLPMNLLMNILISLYPGLDEDKHILYIWWACHFCAMFHSTVNPIIYCARNNKFREGFQFVFRWIPGVHFHWKHLRNDTNMSFVTHEMTEAADKRLSVPKANYRRTMGDANSHSETNLTLLAPPRGTEARKRGNSDCPIVENSEHQFLHITKSNEH